ncbi:hypothetical protein PAHAL_1G416500 [Panicum hallii]|uniref:Uncharacterized protein n=1 Tax=Panicum hallii TaxID=206008 RepID=A0A2T8KY38_9POAL|nr:hypothetical protein PAHAL_1G416500 [Panicum hallii]
MSQSTPTGNDYPRPRKPQKRISRKIKAARRANKIPIKQQRKGESAFVLPHLNLPC